MRIYPAITVFFSSCVLLLPQDKEQPSHPTEPTIAFDRFWEAADPQDYTITVKSSGEAHYVSRNPTRIEKGEQEPDPEYTLDFTVSPANRDRVFTLARDVNYFQGDFNYKHKIADTGKKTLTYADPVRNFQTTYNFSENRSIEEITKLFEGISAVIEHGRKIEFLRRFDKLGLDDELKGLEGMADAGYLAEIQIIAPLLENLAKDTTVLHMARERAQRLLKFVQSP